MIINNIVYAAFISGSGCSNCALFVDGRCIGDVKLPPCYTVAKEKNLDPTKVAFQKMGGLVDGANRTY